MLYVETTMVEWMKRDFKMEKKKKTINRGEMQTSCTVCRGESEIEHISVGVTQEQDMLARSN